MSTQRKKQPERVRAQLTEAAEQIAVGKGLASLTLDAVAQRAGVSKGGLLHHFPSRQALLKGMLAGILARLDAVMARSMACDAEPRGRFTRAYIKTVTTPLDNHFESRLLGAVSLAMCDDPALASLWNAWMRGALAGQEARERSTMATILRFAADGLWLADISLEWAQDEQARAETVAKLLEMSYTI